MISSRGKDAIFGRNTTTGGEILCRVKIVESKIYIYARCQYPRSFSERGLNSSAMLQHLIIKTFEVDSMDDNIRTLS